MVFQFSKKRTKKVELKTKKATDFQFDKPKEVEIKEIQGIMPDSKEEYFVAIALRRLGFDFIYQYRIGGGRLFRGGQVIDFLVFTVPQPTPIFVQGEYWHAGRRNAETVFRVLEAERMLAGQARKPIEIWDYEVPDPEAAFQLLKRKLR